MRRLLPFLFILALPAFPQAPLAWSGQANFGNVGLGASLSESLTLTNGSPTAVKVDLTIRGRKAGDHVGEFAAFVSPTPQGSPALIVPANGNATVEVVFTPTQAGPLTADLTARDSTGTLYSLAISGTGIPAPPTNLQITGAH